MLLKHKWIHISRMYSKNNITQLINFSEKSVLVNIWKLIKRMIYQINNLDERIDSTKQGPNIIFLIFHFYSSNPFDDFHVLTKNWIAFSCNIFAIHAQNVDGKIRINILKFPIEILLISVVYSFDTHNKLSRISQLYFTGVSRENLKNSFRSRVHCLVIYLPRRTINFIKFCDPSSQ